MSLSVRQLLAAGRARALEREPYLAHAIMSLVPRERPGMMRGKGWGVHGTVAPFAVTDGWIMYYDPEVIEYWRQTEPNLEVVCEWLAACIVHEVGHPIREHGARQRAGMYHPRKFNRAADFEINDDMFEAGYKFPPGFGVDPTKDEHIPQGSRKKGLTAEEYYHIDGWQPGDEEDGMCAGGSGAGSAFEDEDEDKDDARSPQDSANIRQQTAKAVKEHAERARGSVPAGWKRWADQELKPPVIPWEGKLRATISGAVEYARGMVERTYRTPYRRQAVFGFGKDSPIMPGWHAPRPEIVVVIDTSGSMGTDELSRATSEVKGILDAMDVDITLMTNDADIHGPIQKISSIEDIEMHGGGGTDFRPPFEYIKDKMQTVTMCIFITDGMGPAPMHNPVPSMHTIWVGVGPYRQKPWGVAPDDEGYHPTGPVQWGEYVEVVEPGGEERGPMAGYSSKASSDDDDDDDEDDDA